MPAPDAPRSAGRTLGAIASGGWKAKAKQAAATLKAEYEAGKQGDTTPAVAIWSTSKEQLEALVGLLRTSKQASEASGDVVGATAADDETTAADAEAVTSALKSVDWAGVRAATTERTGEAAKAMRSMAEQVDWARVQPVAAKISSALIAAVASGQVPLGGPLAGTVARAIADQSGLAQRVARNLEAEKAPLPPDFRGAIEVTSRET